MTRRPRTCREFAVIRPLASCDGRTFPRTQGEQRPKSPSSDPDAPSGTTALPLLPKAPASILEARPGTRPSAWVAGVPSGRSRPISAPTCWRAALSLLTGASPFLPQGLGVRQTLDTWGRVLWSSVCRHPQCPRAWLRLDPKGTGTTSCKLLTIQATLRKQRWSLPRLGASPPPTTPLQAIP